ncbi:hypothetical protein B0187_05105 [Haemophilus paracuniculus]|uniref:Outer membrane protein P2 n=1 Tax=Haemophilus paracuniculus TaxID=734 RepID=A0A1T0ART6_9PAST|nr:porin [Haemophilus paracuniculus]OOR99139.1 hypothetical protein B0187_05105 [Haemophilus paracuniculus]
MKKTLVALAVTAFAASASALTVYEKDGTNVQFDGSLRLLLDNSKPEGQRAHSNLKNDGSRFGVRVKHDIAEDFFALGRLELRFNGASDKKGSDEFGSLYAHRAYVGLGSKQYGEVTFGRQVTIGDDIARAGFDNTYCVTKTPLTTDGKSVIRYDYKGVEGLQVGVDYRFAEDRKDGEVVDGKLKAGYGAGAIYEFGVGEGQSASVAAGYTRDSFATGTNKKHYRDAAMAGASYTINDLTLAADYGYESTKNGDAKRGREHGFQVGAKYKVTPQAAVYGNYLFLVGKNNAGDKKDAAGNAITSKENRANKFMLGAEYQFHKQVKAFVEGKVEKIKYTYNDNSTSRATDRSVGVGLRVFW